MSAITLEIKLPLLIGYEITAEAEGIIFDGEVTELQVYWKRKSKHDKPVPIPEILYNPEEAAKIYYEVAIEDCRDRDRFQRAETMMMEGII